MRRSRHALLRSATAELHDDLERAVDAAGYFSSPAAYGRYLQRLEQLHRTLAERATGAVRLAFFEFGFQDRISWLREDLRQLGLAPLPARTDASGPAISGERSAAAGCLYVILGAALGARFLLRRAESLALQDGAGTTYLSALASARDWPRFLDGLEADEGIDASLLVAGAVATFGCFRMYLTEAVAA